MTYPYSMNSTVISVVVDGVPYSVPSSHANFTLLRDAIRDCKWDEVPDLVSIAKSVTRLTNGLVEVKDDGVYYAGKLSHSSVARRIMELISEGFDVTRFMKFMNKVAANPKFSVVNELFDFLDSGNCPITEDGNFLAYKRVRADYTDCHTGTFDNSVGAVCEMARNEVDDDRHETCSSGLHVCTYSYLASFHGERIVICEVDPADVVAVPTDYGNAKMRVCRYKVIGELDVSFTKEQMDRPVYDSTHSEESHWFYSEDEDTFESEDEEEEETFEWEVRVACLDDEGIIRSAIIDVFTDDDDRDEVAALAKTFAMESIFSEWVSSEREIRVRHIEKVS